MSDALDDLAAGLRKLDAVGSAIATEARADVEKAVRATAAAGTTPSGEAWAPKKDGSGRPLVHAADAVSVEVSGASKATLTIVLRGPEKFHQFGSKKKGKPLPQRQIIPMSSAELQGGAKRAIELAAQRVVAKAIGGGR